MENKKNTASVTSQLLNKLDMHPVLSEKFASYPDDILPRLIEVREIIFELSTDRKIGAITESLKWGQPSYAAKKGSPVRMDWSLKYPDHFSVFFNCKTTLIETFREIYGETFEFKGSREICFSLSEQLPRPELTACLSMSLRYHDIKKLPLLGG